MVEDYGDMFDEMIAGYEEDTAQLGEDPRLAEGEALRAGWYPLEVGKIVARGTSTNGVPYARFLVTVFDGPAKGRRTFISQNMGPSRVKYEDGKPKDRSADEYKEAGSEIKKIMARFLQAIGVGTGVPAGEGAEKVFSFYNVDGWVGSRFMGRLTLQAARTVGERTFNESNGLGAAVALDHVKYGLGAYLAKASVASNGGAPAAL